MKIRYWRLPIAAALSAGLMTIAPVPATAQTGATPPDPTVHTEVVRQIAPGVNVVPDGGVGLVPNVGIIEGHDAILVVDTGLGPKNGEAVYALAKQYAHGRHIYVTTTHFHPEHSFGASAFPAEDFIINRVQAEELAQKGAGWAALFTKLGPGAQAALQGVKIPQPGRTYSGEFHLDLGGQAVILKELPAHTRGDQIIYVPKASVLFTGDLVEGHAFPILFDADANGEHWIDALHQIAALQPAIVVPGHGDVSTVDLAQERLTYLEAVRSMVRESSAQNLSQGETIKALTPRLAALHPGWDNAFLIPFEIAIFYAEAKGVAPTMPPLPGLS